MARDIPIGNGNLLISFDAQYQIRDWYYPWVGQENHTAGHPFHLGVWRNGEFHWVHEPGWERSLTYEPNTLCTHVTLRWPDWPLTITVWDVVDFHEDILIRKFHLHNHGPQDAEVRIFCHYDFHVYGVDVGDTVFYDPMSSALIHYKGRRYFLMSGHEEPENLGIHHWVATGIKEIGGKEGTWRDAEDGLLSGNAIAQGSVDSTFGLTARLGPQAEGVLYAWVANGHSLDEVRTLNDLVIFESPESLLQRTTAFWRLWLNRPNGVNSDNAPLQGPYRRSLLIVRTNIDNRGGIIAAHDSDIMNFSRDTYSYVWPRDGAWVARALDVAGYPELSTRFFAFCADVIDSGGYFLHKYNPTGSLASSWHPWHVKGRPQLPIQEDETGTVLWSLWQHFIRWHDIEHVEPWLSRLIWPAGQFLCDFRDPRSGLPWPSWDLWEERRGVHLYTVAAVYAGIMAAGHFSKAFGELPKAEAFYAAAQEIQQAVPQHFIDPPSQHFGRTLLESPEGRPYLDNTADASLLLIPQLGLIPPDHPVMQATVQWMASRLRVPGAVGGWARYEGDPYQRGPIDGQYPGNPWFICTLWYADYLLMTAKNADVLDEVHDLLQWVIGHAEPSGVLAEQLDPVTGEPLSVSPLTWSHASLMLTIDRYHRACQRWGRFWPNGSSTEVFEPIGF